MDKGGQDRVANAGTRRRTWRTRRVEAGLVEVKEWVRKADLARAQALLEPLIEAGVQHLMLTGRQGRGGGIAVEVRFSGVPPATFRERLRLEWGLEWDRAARCWRGTLADAETVKDLRQHVVPHLGMVEAGGA